MELKQKGAQGKVVTYIVMGLVGLIILYFGLTISINDGHPVWTVALIVITAIAIVGSVYVKIKQLTVILDDEAIHVGNTVVKYEDVEKVVAENRFVVVKLYNVEVKITPEEKDRENFLDYLNEKVEQAKERKEAKKSE